MHARVMVALLAACAAVALLPAAVQAQETEPVALFEDPAGDQSVVPGTLVTAPGAYTNVDLLRLEASQPDTTSVALTVTASGPPSASQNVTVRFRLERGPSSLPNSTAAGDTVTLVDRAGAVTGVDGATRAVAGNSVSYTFPLSAIGAVGGDLLDNASVAIVDFNGGSAPGPVTQDDTHASDEGAAAASDTPFMLARPPVAADIAVTVAGLDVMDGTAQVGTFAAACTNEADAPSVCTTTATVGAANATLTYRVTLANGGLDADTVALEGIPTAGVTVAVAPATLQLAPGASADTTVTVTLAGVAGGDLTIHVRATSTRGADLDIPLRIRIDLPEAPAEPRKPVPEQLGFLTPLATGIGLDKALGVYAELGLFLFVLLLVVVALYFLLFVARTPWVRVRVTPRKAIVAPGGVAEFRVELEGRRGRRFPSLARATLRSEGPWTAGLQVGRQAAPPGESMDIPLEATETGPQEAVVRVQVPFDAPARDRQEIEFDAVPVDADGGSHPKHGAKAKVTVEAAAPATGQYASAHDIRLAEVKHDPPDPRPGATVQTTATVHNDGPAVARLRIVLQKDGHQVSEETVDVPPHDRRSVQLPWTAGAGRNLVKVQIFLA